MLGLGRNNYITAQMAARRREKESARERRFADSQRDKDIGRRFASQLLGTGTSLLGEYASGHMPWKVEKRGREAESHKLGMDIGGQDLRSKTDANDENDLQKQVRAEVASLKAKMRPLSGGEKDLLQTPLGHPENASRDMMNTEATAPELADAIKNDRKPEPLATSLARERLRLQGRKENREDLTDAINIRKSNPKDTVNRWGTIRPPQKVEPTPDSTKEGPARFLRDQENEPRPIPKYTGTGKPKGGWKPGQGFKLLEQGERDGKHYVGFLKRVAPEADKLYYMATVNGPESPEYKKWQELDRRWRDSDEYSDWKSTMGVGAVRDDLDRDQALTLAGTRHKNALEMAREKGNQQLITQLVLIDQRFQNDMKKLETSQEFQSRLAKYRSEVQAKLREAGYVTETEKDLTGSGTVTQKPQPVNLPEAPSPVRQQGGQSAPQGTQPSEPGILSDFNQSAQMMMAMVMFEAEYGREPNSYAELKSFMDKGK